MRLFFLSLFLTAFTLAQAQTISGIAKDDQGAPLNGASIALVKAKDTAVVKLAVTKADGAYVFNDIKDGQYRVAVSHVGYNRFLSTPFSVAANNVTVPAFALTKAAGNLNNVTVSVRKPMVEVKADKTILNVEGTINAAGSDAMELLRKSPGVTIDKDDNISVSGKNGVQVYIDNRPTPLTGSDLTNYLKSLQSSQIEAIEIITNPSAKYEAAGNAGIINIRLKKNKAFGTNGSVTAGYAVGIFSRYNGSFNLNYRNKNLNLYGTYSISKGPNLMQMTIYRTILDSIFDQKGSFMFNNESHNIKIGADYTLSKTKSIGILLNSNLSNPELDNSSRQLISYAPTGQLAYILEADNKSKLKRGSYALNLNYNYTGADGKSLVINLDNGYYDNNNDQYQPNNYYTPSGSLIASRSGIRQTTAPAIIHINSGKLDYEQNFKGGKLGLGGKISYVNTDNNFSQYTPLRSSNPLDVNNYFVYQENINAVYANWNKAYKKGIMIQAGLRVENTVSKGTSSGKKLVGGSYQSSSDDINRNYTDFFPSASITFNKNPMNQWSLTYGRRIDRPGYSDLNPFEFRLDDYSFQKGNVDLRPQFTNSFGVTRIYKYKLVTSLNYSHVSDLFTQIIDTVEKSKSFIQKRNLATQDIASLNISYPFAYKAFNSFVNLNTNYSKYKADFGANRKVDLNTFGLTLFAQNSLRFAKVWTAEVSGFYNAPTIYQGTFKAKSLWNLDAGLQKTIFGGNGTIKASFSDVFHSLQFRATSDFAGQTTKFTGRPEAQQFKLNLTWRFGSTTVKGAKQKTTSAEDERKRAEQQNNGGIGIGGQQ